MQLHQLLKNVHYRFFFSFVKIMPRLYISGKSEITIQVGLQVFYLENIH